MGGGQGSCSPGGRGPTRQAFSRRSRSCFWDVWKAWHAPLLSPQRHSPHPSPPGNSQQGGLPQLTQAHPLSWWPAQGLGNLGHHGPPTGRHGVLGAVLSHRWRDSWAEQPGSSLPCGRRWEQGQTEEKSRKERKLSRQQSGRVARCTEPGQSRPGEWGQRAVTHHRRHAEITSMSYVTTGKQTISNKYSRLARLAP